MPAEKKEKETSPLIVALSAAQGEFSEIQKDKTNTYFKSKYATLDAVIKATRPILAKHKLAISSHFEQHAETPTLTTTLHHVSGETIHSSIPVIPGEGMQGLGSAITYARRYAICGLLNVAADEDDDGNAANQSPAKPVKRPATKKVAAKPTVRSGNALVERAKASFEAAADGKALLASVTKVGEYRDHFPDALTYTQALVSAYPCSDICTAPEFEEVKRLVVWYTNSHPDNKAKVTPEEDLNAQAEEVFG